MKSGTIVQSRDQVLIGSRCPVCCRSTRSSSRVSTYGPFFSERPIVTYLPKPMYFIYRRDIDQESLSFGCIMRTRATATDDRRIGRLPFLPGLPPLGKDAGRTARVSAARRSPFTTAHRMADRIHRRAAVVRLTAHPALPAGFAQADVHVLGVADGPDGRPASRADAEIGRAHV